MEPLLSLSTKNRDWHTPPEYEDTFQLVEYIDVTVLYQW